MGRNPSLNVCVGGGGGGQTAPLMPGLKKVAGGGGGYSDTFFLLQSFWGQFSRHRVGYHLTSSTSLTNKQAKKVLLFWIPKSWWGGGGGGRTFDIMSPTFQIMGGLISPLPHPPDFCPCIIIAMNSTIINCYFTLQ